MPRPTILKFYLDPNDTETELTCLLCGGQSCELSFTVRGGNKVQILGVHGACVDKHDQSTREKLVKLDD